MKTRKLKAITVQFRCDRRQKVITRPGKKPETFIFEKGTQFTGIPTVRPVKWKGIYREAFDLLLNDDRLVLSIWYEAVKIL